MFNGAFDQLAIGQRRLVLGLVTLLQIVPHGVEHCGFNFMGWHAGDAAGFVFSLLQDRV